MKLPSMTVRNERAICLTVIALMWLFFFVQALHTPTLLDDWYQLTWHRHHPLALSSIWAYAHYNYFNFNPRIGDVLLMLVNGPRWIHLLTTPLVQLSLLPLTFAITFGRWPRLTLRDFEMLFIFQTLIWLVMPIPGVVYFYRPFATNYLWAFVVTLALFVPYRFALARPEPAPPRLWLAPAMLVLGWLAGMGNEHTGPMAIVVMLAFLIIAHRKRRLRVWMLAGALGLVIGVPMLLWAPGQALRYGGMGAINTPMHMLAARGFDGTFEVLLDFVAELEVGLGILVIAVLVGHRRLPAIERGPLLAIFALLVGALGIVATLFASPSVGERLFFAPAVLAVGAMLIVIDWLRADSRARRLLMIVCAVLFAYQAFRMLTVLADGYEQNQARMAMLRAAPPNTVVKVPPYLGIHWKRTRWWWGDDFQFASLREYVANEVYDLKGIEYDRHQRWVEPTPIDRFVIERTFDPPLSPEEDAKLEPRYVPIFWEWALVQMRRSRELGPIAFVEGHKLVHYVVTSVGARFVDPKGRPVRVFEWTPSKLTFVDGRMFDDPNNATYVRVWAPSMPANTTDIYVESCGKTTRVEKRSDVFDEFAGDYHVGPLIPITLSCRGTHTAYVCDPQQCWFAGRYWR